MRKGIGVLFLLLCLTVGGAWGARAETSAQQSYDTQLAESGAAELFEALPEETRERLHALGIDGLSFEEVAAPTPQAWWQTFQASLSGESALPVSTLAVLMGIVLLCAATDGLRHTVTEPALAGVYRAVCTAGAGVAMAVPLSACISRVVETARSVTVFMSSFVPVYAGILAGSGRVTAAASYQTLLLAAAQGTTLLITGLIVPLMAVSLALGLTGSVSEGLRVGAVGDWINKASTWLLGTVSSLFVGFLSLQQSITGSADGVTARAVKLSLSSFVPVVGGALSEALATVQGSLTLLRSTVGMFGVAAVAVLLLPPLCACLLWAVGVSLCRMMAELLELSSLSAMFRTVGGVIKVLIGALVACGMVMIVSTALVMAAGRGG